jgi:hypothetical protein
MRLPRLRYTILSLMIVVVLVSLVMRVIVARRKQVQRMIALNVAQAEYQNAKLTREVSEIAVTEYLQGIYPQDYATVKYEVTRAETVLNRANQKLDAARRLRSKETPSETQAVETAQRALEQAKQKMTMLENSIRDRTLKDLQSEVEHARAVELARKADYDRLNAIGTGLFW